MRKFFELIYFGAYYFVWMFDRMVGRHLKPVMYPILVLFLQIPYFKRNLAKRGLTPRQHVDATLKLCDKLADSNYGHIFEWHIYPMLTSFYVFVYFDIMWILRIIFGNDWGIIRINSANGGIIFTVIGALAMFSASRMESTVGQDKTIMKYRRKSKSVHRKALALFLGCCALVLLGFYFLFLRR